MLWSRRGAAYGVEAIEYTMNFCCMVHNAKRGGIGLGSAVRFVICHIKDEKGRRNEGRE